MANKHTLKTEHFRRIAHTTTFSFDPLCTFIHSSNIFILCPECSNEIYSNWKLNFCIAIGRETLLSPRMQKSHFGFHLHTYAAMFQFLALEINQSDKLIIYQLQRNWTYILVSIAEKKIILSWMRVFDFCFIRIFSSTFGGEKSVIIHGAYIYQLHPQVVYIFKLWQLLFLWNPKL